MEQWIEGLVRELHTGWLLVLIAACLAVLGWAADKLVREAVALSERSGIPKTVIGATVVSLGTTAPEAAVSVWAAINGEPDLALGNAVGSILCDTGLILGVATLIAPLRVDRNIVARQGRIQLASGFLLVAFCMPWARPLDSFTAGGTMPRWAGFLFLALLAIYLWLSARWARRRADLGALEEFEGDVGKPLAVVAAKLFGAIFLVIAAANVLIPAVEVAAERLGVPDEVVAASIVAFGTSLPEFVTAITATRRGHGDLAVGNIVGADILNVLFVAGAAACATPDGLEATPHFFRALFPTMIFILIVFRLGVIFSRGHLRARFGLVLLAAYVAVSVLNYTVVEAPGGNG